ncbi:hypothetical protein RY831_26375 [Noviherbaspirillum sp. CPCC 100848]|uniref:Uncharacterized protein n=1 Tax=Noviherbaspirillum album TaxID=3080276 RepID=A0ABU6JHM7_9BURK|nr:hypothetical protein [Noviherbaspirillum sp. CPCC 100848]MEC4722697.1 hypothetical protein [Noviherbaspirillum sp. CPCC 100848]
MSPVALSHLQALHYWLRNDASGWDIALPENEVVAAGKEYPPFPLYRDGLLICMVESPEEMFERIGDAKLTHKYEKLVNEDPDNPLA